MMSRVWMMSRAVGKSGEKWGKVGKSGERWGKVGKVEESGGKYGKSVGVCLVELSHCKTNTH